MQDRELTVRETYENVRISLGPELCAILDQPGWSDVMVESSSYESGKVAVDTDIKRLVPCRVNENGIAAAARVLAAYTNQGFNDSDHQTLDAVIPLMNLRCSFVSPPASSHALVTFRKPNQRLMTLDELLAMGTLTRTQADFLIETMARRRNLIFSGGTGCHAKGTRILMADGTEKAVEDIVVGDRVMGDDGHARRVLQLHKGVSRMYRIIPDIGTPCTVNEGHVLALVSRRTGGKREIPLKDYLLMAREERQEYCEYFVPGVHYLGSDYKFKGEEWNSREDLPVDPYIFGYLAGRALISSSMEPDMVLVPLDREKDDPTGLVLEAFGEWEEERMDRTDGLLRFAIATDAEGKESLAIILGDEEKTLFDIDARTGTFTAGPIPPAYLRAERGEREDLLAGLLDGAPCRNNPEGGDLLLADRCTALAAPLGMDSIAFRCVGPYQDNLVEDIIRLARSVGFYATGSEKPGMVLLGGDFSTIPTGNYITTRYGSRRTILPVAFCVEDAGEDEYFGMTVDGNHLFCLADFMVQRNSGKTSLMNTMLNLIDPMDRLYIIEDISEVICDIKTHPFNERIVINRQYSYADAIATALRQRPDRIIIGECRYGNQALEMLKAWGTGHPGGLSTIHANDARNVLERLDQLCSEVSVSSQKAMIHDVIDVVVQMGRLKNSTKRLITELYDIREDRYIE